MPAMPISRRSEIEELRQANGILELASAYCAKAELGGLAAQLKSIPSRDSISP